MRCNIFKQYLLTKKSWYGPDEMSVLVPKDGGEGVMISAFQSRELGFRVKLTQVQLDEINFIRRKKITLMRRRQKIER